MPRKLSRLENFGVYFICFAMLANAGCMFATAIISLHHVYGVFSLFTGAVGFYLLYRADPRPYLSYLRSNNLDSIYGSYGPHGLPDNYDRSITKFIHEYRKNQSL